MKHLIIILLSLIIEGAILQTTDDDTALLIEAEPNRVFGIGVGLFVLIFFFILCILICVIGSYTRYPNLIKSVSFFVFFLIFSILVFSPKDPQFAKEEEETLKYYDPTFVRKILIGLLLLLSSGGAATFVLLHKLFHPQKARVLEEEAVGWV